MKVVKIFLTALVLVLSLLLYNFMFNSEEVMTIGIIDRIENAEMAVILIEAETTQIELHVNEFSEIPKEGDVLQLQWSDEGYEVILIDSKLSKKRKQQVNDILYKLQK